MRKFTLLLSTSLLLSCTFATPLLAQTGIWDGVYSEEQASRGEQAYRANCESCHGRNLGGNSNTPSLLGMSFMFIWEGRSLGELFGKMRDNMPSDRPASLSTESYQDLLAFLLKSNSFPAGQQSLDASSAIMNSISIVPAP